VTDLDGFGAALAKVLATGSPAAALGVCQTAVAWLPLAGAALTVMVSTDRQELVCASDATAARIDELQFALGEGPCVEAFTTGRTVQIADIADTTDTTAGGHLRWPMFAAAAAETGARGMCVFPLMVGADRLGVLDCYRDTPGLLRADELAGALRAADAAVWTLLDQANTDTQPGGHEPDPDGAASSSPPGGSTTDWSGIHRAEVHQATGVIIAQVGGSAAGALARLRAAAFTAGRPIDELARDVLAKRLRFDDRDAGEPR
jgi:hypothetical protein